MKKFVPTFFALMILLVILKSLYTGPALGPGDSGAITYDSMLIELNSGNLSEVYLKGSTIYAKTKKGDVLVTQSVGDNWFVSDVLKRGDVKLSAVPPEQPSVLSTFFWSFGPVLLMIGMFVYFNKKASGGGGGGQGGMFNFGKSKATIGIPEGSKITFADVAGCDEAKAEVAEIVDFLKNPTKYKKVGGRSPKGVLMVGPPGTGKTLLAKAMAGEAQVAFTSMSGSDFVEMFVGVGAARVRDLFEKAKRHAPCIIFIDEIDAVGRHRGVGTGGGSDEREQTLNQLLVEMDGFESESGVIVIAATNRADVLDPALLRPGRFDRQVAVSLPDVRGREQILNVHMRKIPVGPTVNVTTIAKGTPRFSGAELENLVNEAALCAARDNLVLVEMAHFETAKDKILMGPEKKSMKMSESEKSDTAYHEAGHAVIAHVLEHTDPVHKVSIIPRSGALGVTVQLPDQERFSMGKKRILDTIAVLFGGRVAEELFTGDITTGASNDYERATQLAKNMVTKWGMSESMGHMVVGAYGADPFSGNGASMGQNTASPDTMKKVDDEVNVILNEQYERVKALLTKHAPEMHKMRDMLMDVETIDNDDIHKIMGTVAPPR